MDNPSSISSSDAGRFGRWPIAALVALLLFALGEWATRRWFHLGNVGAATWKELYPAYDGGFSESVCYARGDEMVCAPTPYLNVAHDSFPRRSAEEEIRVFTIGASVSRGARTSYSTELESRLARELAPKAVRVVNLSAVGIGAERQRLRFEESLRYRPDLVILHVHGSNEYEDYRDRRYLAALHRGLGGLVLRSRFVVLAKKLLNRTFELAGPVQVARDTPGGERAASRDPEKAALFRTTLREHTEAMLARARAARLPVIVVGRAERGGPGPESMNELFRSAAAASGASYLDLWDAIGGLSAEQRKSLFRDNVHLSPRGNRYVADRLIEPIRALLAGTEIRR